MATQRTPSREGLRQLNFNDTVGEIWSSFNVDFTTNPGKVKLSRPQKQVASSADLSGDTVQAFTVFDGRSYALTSNDLYRGATNFLSWEVVDTTPFQADDMVVFGGQIVITTGTDIDAYDGSTYTSDWWTARGNPSLRSSSGAGPKHNLEVLRIGEEKLAVTDGPEVHSYRGGIGSGAILSSTVDLGDSFTSTCIKTSTRTSFIGTYTSQSEEAYVFQWDGASTNYTQLYPVGAKAVLSMVVVDDVPLIVTETGEIKRFNNAGFTTVAQFPFAFKPTFVDSVTTGLIQSSNAARLIHPKGMYRSGNTVYIFINTESDDYPIDERTPSGLWALDLSTYSLNHLSAISGESVIGRSSPVMIINDENGRIFLGGTLDNSEEGIWIEDLATDSANYGYFTTTEFASDSVKDMYEEVVVKALLGSDDKIVMKYRTERDVELPINSEVEWYTETQFNTTEDLSHVKTRFDDGHRDEVEILSGSGAGRLAHITNVESSSGTYSVTIDESLGTIGESAKVRVDNWSKIPKEMISSDGEVLRFGIGQEGTWCQVKCELIGKNGYPEVRELIVKSNNKESL